MRIYGRWKGNSKGELENIEKCVVGIWDRDSWRFYQCMRKRGYGKDGLFCKQHSKMTDVYVPKEESSD